MWYIFLSLFVVTSFPSLEAHRGKAARKTYLATIRMGTEEIPTVMSGLEHVTISSLYGDKYSSVGIVDCRKMVIEDLRNIIPEDNEDSTLLLKVISSQVIINKTTFPFEKLIVSVSGGGSVIFKERPAECITVKECTNGSSLVVTNNDESVLTILMTESCADSSLTTQGVGPIAVRKSSYLARLGGILYVANARTHVCSELKKLIRVFKR